MVKLKKNDEPLNFESALAELNQMVEQMEKGNLSLEDSLKSFERGVLLVRNCQATLRTAEQKVQLLTQQSGESTLSDFESEA